MFSKEAYETAVRKSGFRKRFISDSLGLGYDTFVKKVNGVTQWKLNEIDKLVELLNLSDAERNTIFFNCK